MSERPSGTRIGPVEWPADNRTLFWHLAPLWTEYFQQPDGPNAGQPWEFTPEQARFIAWWYAFDEYGRFVYRQGVLRRMKGWGKDPVGAVLTGTEMLLPCRFDGWDAHGNPVAAPHTAPWVQVVAVSRDQTRNTFRLYPGLFSPHAISTFSMELNKEIVYANKGRAVIEAVTSSPYALEGGRATFVLKNETQWWLSNNEGHAMAGVIAGNLAKSRGGSARALSICNAHVPGMDSVAEREWDAYEAIRDGRSKASPILYDSLEAPADTDMSDRESLTAGVLVARGDSEWLDPERLLDEVWDPQTPPSESRRKYLNQIVAPEDAWCAPHEWDRLADPELMLEDGDIIALGFDGSKTDDHTALVAVRIEDGAVFPMGIWDPEQHHGEAPREIIDETVQRVFNTYDVVAFFADLHPWESYVDKWAEEHRKTLCAVATTKHAVAFDMRARTREFNANGAMRTADAIAEQTFRHTGAPTLRQHVLNARRRPDRWNGVGFGKEHRESKRKVDALAAMVLARLAADAYRALPDNKKRRKRSGRAAFF